MFKIPFILTVALFLTLNGQINSSVNLIKTFMLSDAATSWRCLDPEFRESLTFSQWSDIFKGPKPYSIDSNNIQIELISKTPFSDVYYCKRGKISIPNGLRLGNEFKVYYVTKKSNLEFIFPTFNINKSLWDLYYSEDLGSFSKYSKYEDTLDYLEIFLATSARAGRTATPQVRKLQMYYPSNYLAFNALGQYFAVLKLNDQAISYFERAIELTELSGIVDQAIVSGAMFNLANVLIGNRENVKALATLRRAKASDSNNFNIYSTESVIFFNNSNYVSSRIAMEQALDIISKTGAATRIDPHTIGFFYYLHAQSCKFLKDTASARRSVLKAMEYLPDNDEYRDFLRDLNEIPAKRESTDSPLDGVYRSKGDGLVESIEIRSGLARMKVLGGLQANWIKYELKSKSIIITDEKGSILIRINDGNTLSIESGPLKGIFARNSN